MNIRNVSAGHQNGRETAEEMGMKSGKKFERSVENASEFSNYMLKRFLICYLNLYLCHQLELNY